MELIICTFFVCYAAVRIIRIIFDNWNCMTCFECESEEEEKEHCCSQEQTNVESKNENVLDKFEKH